MRSLVFLLVAFLIAPRAEAGEFTPRTPKEPAADVAPAAKPSAKAKPVSRRTWQAKVQPKKAKKKQIASQKRPLP
ncbi:MAG: hypothetical protein H0V17_08650 [Deltaproteobacteria bacterium]|nr:hypothetical protein [Deltaproteobacteria bacterium]